MARFAYKLRLTEEEEQLVRPMTELIMEVLTLHNDYYSWEKEAAFYNASEDKLPMSNAVALYMKWRSLTPEEAKGSIKDAAIEREKQYLRVKSEFMNRKLSSNQAVPSAVLQWLSIIEHMVAGNLLWSLTCPRYHGHVHNQYRDYFQLRCSQGHNFADDCTRSETFTGLEMIESPAIPALYSPGNGCLSAGSVGKADQHEHSTYALSQIVYLFTNHKDPESHIPPLFLDPSLKQPEDTVGSHHYASHPLLLLLTRTR
jgi:hypothetical protein